MDIEALIPWTATFPELILAFSAMMLLLLGAFNGDKSTRAINACAVITLLLVLLAVVALQFGIGVEGKIMSPGGFLTADIYSSFMKLLVLLAAILCLLITPGYLARQDISRPEYPVLVLFSVIGMMLMVSASNFLMLYIGLELQSLALYVLAAFRRDTVRSSEAGLKYFVLGALASGLLLYGISLIYGFTGTLDFAKVAHVVAQQAASPGIAVGMAFILAALAFKVSAAPFHMWTPDVYEGAPTTVTAFFSVAPKLAAMGLLMQVLFVPFAPLAADWQMLVAALSALSMFVGALGAIGQTNIKRLLAYSSIGHVGFALMALSAETPKGIEAVLLYLAFYVVMSIGAFAVVLMMRRDGRMVEELSDLSGISRLYPGLAACMAIIMFSMAGIPPMVGFFTKLFVFIAAIQGQMVWLAGLGAIASVVGAYYYLRVIKIMYFDEPVAGFDQPVEICLSTTLVITSVLTLAGAALLTPLSLLVHMAAGGLVQP